MKYKYPLQTDPFTLWDRIKTSLFLINENNRLTMGTKVAEFEKKLEEYVDGSKAIVVSSGSTANHLLVEVHLQTYNEKPSNTTVFTCATSWASNYTPWLMRGYNVKPVDINLRDLSFDYKKLEAALKADKSEHKIIFVTALIGFIPNVNKLRDLAYKNNAYLYADLCETTIGYWEGQPILSCFDMTTTSFYHAHEISSIEGGALFIRDGSGLCYDKIENALMIRSHGLVRTLPNGQTKATLEKNNPDIDKEFLFNAIGTNYRSNDLLAFLGLRDLTRIGNYETHRRELWTYFNTKLEKTNVFKSFNTSYVPFCLPIVLDRCEDKQKIKSIKKELNDAGWETRPVISFLPKNPAFRFLGKEEDYPNSAYLHYMGCYVGLPNSLTRNDIDKLFEVLT